MKIKEIKWQGCGGSAGIRVGFIEDYWLPHLFHYYKKDKGGWWCLIDKISHKGGSYNLRSEQECKDKAAELLKEHLALYFEEGRLES